MLSQLSVQLFFDMHSANEANLIWARRLFWVCYIRLAPYDRKISFMDHRSHMATLEVSNCTNSARLLSSSRSNSGNGGGFGMLNILLWVSERWDGMNLTHGAFHPPGIPETPTLSSSSIQLLTKLTVSPCVGGLDQFHTQKPNKIHLAWHDAFKRHRLNPFCKARSSLYPLS